MKKLFFVTLFASQLALFAQTGYQIPNSNFETWETVTVGNVSGSEPIHWNSHIDNQGTLASSARSVQIEQSADAHSGNYSCAIKPRWVLLVWANGVLTTGRVNAGNVSAGSSTNHNVTLRTNPDFNIPFYGQPDSIIFWAKYVANNATRQARMSAFIHGDYNCTDPLAGNANSTNYIVGHAEENFTRGNQDWNRHAVSFDFNYTHNDPQYILVTFSTNATPGGTANANDRLYIDDIEMVYNIHLNDLQVAGTTIPNFHKDTLTYNYYLCVGDTFPTITYTGSSPRADILVEQADIYNPSATVTVGNTGWHTDSIRTYTVNFIYRSVVQTPVTSNLSLCGQGQAVLSATFGTNGTSCRWYSDTLLAAIETDTLCNLGYCSNDTVIYVSSYNENTGCESYKIPVFIIINTIPGVPTVADDTVFVAEMTFISAQAGANANICRWYASDTSTTVLQQSNSFNITAYRDTSFWVSSYNTATACESGKVEKKVFVKIRQNPANIFEFSHFACDAYEWRNVIYTTSGTYNDTLIGGASNNNDSILIMHLTIYETAVYEFNDTACLSYLWKDSLYTESSILRDTLSGRANNGCDSVVILHLFVKNPVEEFVIYDTTCQGYTYTENGFNLPVQINVGTQRYERTIACDTVIQLYLTVNRSYLNREISYTACDSYTYNDSTYSESGDYSHIFKTVSGCDSIVTLKLTINNSSTTHITDEICQADAYTANGFSLPAQDETGTFEYSLNLKNAAGCDSIVYLTLTVHPAGTLYIQDTMTFGGTYTDFGFNITPESTGIYHDTLSLQSSHGCDSNVVLLLVVQPKVSTIERNNIPQSVYLYPNPAQGQISISASADITQMEMFDISGRLLGVYSGGKTNMVYDISRYSRGVYFVKIQTENGLFTEKLIIY